MTEDSLIVVPVLQEVLSEMRLLRAEGRSALEAMTLQGSEMKGLRDEVRSTNHRFDVLNGRIPKLEERVAALENGETVRKARLDGAAAERQKWSKAARLLASVVFRKDTLMVALFMATVVAAWFGGKS